MHADVDAIPVLHEMALRRQAVDALRSWFAVHSRTGVSQFGRPQVVPTDNVGQQIARALMVLGESLHDPTGVHPDGHDHP